MYIKSYTKNGNMCCRSCQYGEEKITKGFRPMFTNSKKIIEVEQLSIFCRHPAKYSAVRMKKLLIKCPINEYKPKSGTITFCNGKKYVQQQI